MALPPDNRTRKMEKTARFAQISLANPYEKWYNQTQMKVELSPHAENQLKERNIGLNIVFKVLNKPDQIIETAFRNRQIAQKIIISGKKKFLYRVIFIKERNVGKIITVYKTTKINKYLKEGKK